MRLTIRPTWLIAGLALAASALGATAAGAQASAGQEIYRRACAGCHAQPEVTRSPALDTLQKMSRETIEFAITRGKMQAQAAALSAEARGQLLDYLTGSVAGGAAAKADDAWIAAMACPAARKAVNLKAAATVTGFGFDLRNQRRLTRAQTGLATADFAKLELAWAIGFPKATTMRSQPAVVGSTLFLPVAEANRVFAIDVAGPPCLKWVYKGEQPMRTSAAFGALPGSGRKVLVFADVASDVHMVDAATGTEIWKQNVALFPLSITTGTPVIHKDRVYVPVSQYEITTGAQNASECCKTHGAVTALDAATGKKIWTAHTMPDAKPVRDRGDGKMLWGPSGAPIWNSPAIDEKRGQLYVGTGEATSEPAWETTDAIMAIALADGKIRWHHQATENDIFLTGCGPNSKNLNCPKSSVFRDVDFGASMILARRPDGSEVVVGGQKSGTLWALDPDTGKLVWKQAFGEGSPLGGIHWGIAFDGTHVYAPINRPSGRGGGTDQKPGMHAVDVRDGKVAWTFVAQPDCSGDRKARVRGCDSNIGLSGAPSVIDGAVIEGGLDGFLRAFDAKTGKVLFTFDTAKPFQTVNGVAGAGGAIDNASIVAANGYLFVASGYGMFGQPPGNVLLAFKPKK